MCNLYNLNKGQDALRRYFKVTQDDSGNQPPLPGIFPDMMAPVIRTDAASGNGVAGRVMEMMRWGMPTPPRYLKPGAIDRGVTNIRDTRSPHWRAWLRPEFRCLVPATAFSEPTDAPNPATGKKLWAWFALSEDLPLFAFAGIWTGWRGTRGTKKAPVEGRHTLYAFLTTQANAVVAPVHSKAMPVLLTTADEQAAWLSAPLEEALKLQRPLPDDALRLVAMVEKADEWTPAAAAE
jgi:putative SOS response-associated peptidase YedK